MLIMISTSMLSQINNIIIEFKFLSKIDYSAYNITVVTFQMLAVHKPVNWSSEIRALTREAKLLYKLFERNS